MGIQVLIETINSELYTDSYEKFIDKTSDAFLYGLNLLTKIGDSIFINPDFFKEKILRRLEKDSLLVLNFFIEFICERYEYKRGNSYNLFLKTVRLRRNSKFYNFENCFIRF